MSKYYLFTSNDEKGDDVLVNLDKLLTIRLINHSGDYLIVADYTERDSIKMRFSSEAELREALKDLLFALGLADEYAEKMKIYYRQESETKKEILKLLSEAI